MKTIKTLLLMLLVTVPSMAEDRIPVCNYVTGQPDSNTSSEVKYFAGTLSDQDGKPVSCALVSLYCYSYETQSILAEYTAESNANGQYSVCVDQSERGYFLKVSAPGFPCYQVNHIFFLSDPLDITVAPPTEDITLYNKLCFRKGQQATIILPEAPDPSWGRYYRLDRRENIQDIIFEREYSPLPNVPYVIFPERDFTIDLSTYDTEVLPEPGFVSFPDNDANRPLGLYGTYQSCYAYIPEAPAWFNTILDTTPDCEKKTKNGLPRVGAFRAYLVAYAAKPKFDEPRLIFAGEQTGIDEVVMPHATGIIVDLQGRRLSQKPERGVYIQGGRKVVIK